MRALEFACRLVACLPFAIGAVALFVLWLVSEAWRFVSRFGRGIAMDWRSWKGSK
jgi:hypothetical protein